mmetsp:Transcript_85719/g.246037  ORF Transcript_85719/g.246037 Transcript_85719/m.246037 type:complete len:279 (-) Transcript_85719:861-1697(-)
MANRPWNLTRATMLNAQTNIFFLLAFGAGREEVSSASASSSASSASSAAPVWASSSARAAGEESGFVFAFRRSAIRASRASDSPFNACISFCNSFPDTTPRVRSSLAAEPCGDAAGSAAGEGGAAGLAGGASAAVLDSAACWEDCWEDCGGPFFFPLFFLPSRLLDSGAPAVAVAAAAGLPRKEPVLVLGSSPTSAANTLSMRCSNALAPSSRPFMRILPKPRTSRMPPIRASFPPDSAAPPPPGEAPSEEMAARRANAESSSKAPDARTLALPMASL